MTPQPSASEKFQEAEFLLRHGEFEQSLELLLQCLADEPMNERFVETFIAALQERRKTAGSSAAAERPLPEEIARAVRDAKWRDVFLAGHRELVRHPTNVALLMAMSDACVAQGLAEQELTYLEYALSLVPQDVEALRRAGRVLAELRELDAAIERWSQVETLSPDDPDAASWIARLTIERGRDRAGLEAFFGDESSTEPRPTPRRVFARKRQTENRTTTESLLGQFSSTSSKLRQLSMQQLEAAVKEAPSNPENYLRLAVIYLEKGRDYDAEKLLSRGRAETGDDARIRHLWEHTTLIRCGARVGLAQRQVEIKDNEQTRAELAAVQRELDELEADVFSRRAERDPGDAALHFELGARLRKAGNPRGAMIHLKEAMRERSQTCAAAFEMGECFRELNEPREALHAFRIAADAPCEVEQFPFKANALHRAAQIVVAGRMYRLAIRYLTALLRIQPSHQEGAKLLAETQAKLA